MTTGPQSSHLHRKRASPCRLPLAEAASWELVLWSVPRAGQVVPVAKVIRGAGPRSAEMCAGRNGSARVGGGHGALGAVDTALSDKEGPGARPGREGGYIPRGAQTEGPAEAVEGGGTKSWASSLCQNPSFHTAGW